MVHFQKRKLGVIFFIRKKTKTGGVDGIQEGKSYLSIFVPGISSVHQTWVNSLLWKLFNLKMRELSRKLLFSKGKVLQRALNTEVYLDVNNRYFPFLPKGVFFWGYGHVILIIGFIFLPLQRPLFPPLTFYATAAPNVPQKMGNFQIIKLCCLSTSNYKGVAVLCVSLIIAIFSDLVRRNG